MLTMFILGVLVGAGASALLFESGAYPRVRAGVLAAAAGLAAAAEWGGALVRWLLS